MCVYRVHEGKLPVQNMARAFMYFSLFFKSNCKGSTLGYGWSSHTKFVFCTFLLEIPITNFSSKLNLVREPTLHIRGICATNAIKCEKRLDKWRMFEGAQGKKAVTFFVTSSLKGSRCSFSYWYRFRTILFISMHCIFTLPWLKSEMLTLYILLAQLNFFWLGNYKIFAQ